MINFKMFEILEKHFLHESVVLVKIYAPLISKHAKAGQFVVVRAVETSERIPLTIVDYDEKAGIIVLIFQIVGATTKILSTLKEHDVICDVLGPLGKPTILNGFKNVCVVGGGVGCANAFAIAKGFKQFGINVCVIAGFKNENLIILKQEFEHLLNKKLFITTNDGSCGEKGFVTDMLKKLILKLNQKFDLVFVAGPVPMMKAVCQLTKKFKIKTIASMNPIMIDGTGMCGCCRVKINGKIKFACVDGADFDGHLVDFDDVINRLKFYENFEKKAFTDACNLLKG